jgi:hypothetical protein
LYMTGEPKRWLVGWVLAALVVGVCAAQTLPLPIPLTAPEPLDPGSAKVVELIGDVSVLGDSDPWALHVGSQVRPRQMILTGPDGWAMFELSDGSTFQVFPNSRVTFRANPGGWEDLLDLWLGHVKVYIQKLGDQPNRNRIFTPTAVISVRGTVFDVMIEDDEDTTLVSVDEGEVDVRHRLIGESRSKLVQQGEYLRVYKNVPLASSAIDKNALAGKILRAASDALYQILIQTRAGGSSVPGGGTPGGSTGGGGPQLPGDTGGTPDPGNSGGGPTSTPVPNAPSAPPPPPGS